MTNHTRDGLTPSTRNGRKQGRSSLLGKVVPDALRGEQKYRGFFEEAVFGIFRTTPDGRFIDANDALARILGYESREDLMQAVSDVSRQVHVDAERRKEFARLLEEEGAVTGFEAQAYRKDGSTIWISLSARKLEDGRSEVRYEGIVEDITDRKEIEEALRSSEERFYKAFHASPAAKSIVSAADRRFLDINDRFLDILGYTRNEVIGRTADELEIWADLPERERFQAQIAKTGLVRDTEVTLRAKDGSLRRVLGSAVVIHVEGEVCILSLLYDITERKKAEEELRESERRYRELIHALGVAVYMTDAEGRITLYNDAAVEAWGRTPDLDVDRWCSSWRLYRSNGTPLPHEDCPLAQTIKSGVPVRGVEVIAERPDGTRRMLLPYPTPLRDANGNIRGGVNLLVDITDRKLMEEALREREARLAAVLNTAADGIIAIDSRGVIQEFNAAAARIFGYTAEEMVGKNVKLLMPEPYRAEHDAYLRRYLETGEARIIGIGREVMGRRKDGSTFPLELAVSEVRVGDDTTFTGIVRDISDRRKMLASLSEERQRLDLAMQAGKMGAWEWDVNSGAVRWSETLEAIHGLEPGQFGGTFEAYLYDIHPDDRERVIETVSGAVRSGNHHTEYRIIRPDGEERWVSAKGELVRDAQGNPDRLIGLCMDITDRKRAEDADRFLSEASAMLAATSTDLQMTLANIARITVPYLADLAAVMVVDENRNLAGAAVNHINPRRMKLVDTLREQYQFDPTQSFGVARVLKSGESEFYPTVGDEMVRAAARDQVHLKLLRRLGIKSGMVVPLLARGRVVGALILTITESSRRYTEADLALAEDLGRRAGLAVDNAALYLDLEKALEAKDEFLGLMSHELRTPITTIYGGARMIRSRGERLDDDQKDRLMVDIEQESERLFRMVEDLLALARVELGHKPATEPVLIQRTVERVSTAFAQRRPGRLVELKVDEDLPPIAGQPVYVEQVLRNLLSNADKYSPAASPIEIRAHREEGGVNVSVVDRGEGVPEDEKELIFERFYRSSHAPRLAGGAGLGLTVCKRLIEAQEGHVWARSSEYGGLEVGFFLPDYQEESK